MPPSPARTTAFDILLRVESESSYASELLHSNTYANLSTPDHALATELVMGVLRWRSLLDDKISSASSQPLKKVDPEVLIALRLALGAEMANEMLLTGARVLPNRAINEGFAFAHPDLPEALRHAILAE